MNVKPRQRLAWAAGVVAALAAISVWVARVPGANAELRALVAAVGTDRPIEGRLAGGFAYGPLHSPTRAGEPSTLSVLPDVRIAAARVENCRDASDARRIGVSRQRIPRDG